MRSAFTAATLAAVSLLVADPTLAADTDQAVATAPIAGPGSVAAQIDDYLRTSPTLVLPKDTNPGVTTGEADPRKVHGEVSVSVGNHGYRSAYVRSDFPVGKTGTVSVAVAQSEGGYRYGGPGYRYGSGRQGAGQSLGLAFNFDNSDSPDRCRIDDGRARMEPQRYGARACRPDELQAR